MKSVCSASNRRVKATLAAIGLCFAVVSTTPAAAPAAPVATGACETTAAKVKVSKTYQETNLTTYVNVTDTPIAFTQGRTDCVIVSFSSEAFAAANTSMFVRAVLDGNVCEPDDNRFVASVGGGGASDFGNRAMNFLCLNVAPGNHTVKMQFRSTSDGTVALQYRTMIVHYAK